MRAREFLLELKKVGREFNHVEDLVFTDPDQGAVKAIEILRNLEQDSSDVAVKWDGYPTMYWGRDEDGTFVLTGKNGWGRNKSTSADDLSSFILSTGKGEEWRERFAGDMAALWPLFERATPKDFRGYVYADILIHPGAPANTAGDTIKFTPNEVTYTVKKDSDLGAQIANKKAVVAATMMFDEFGSKNGKPFNDQDIFQGDIAVLGQTYVDHRPAVDVPVLDKLESVAKSAQPQIKKFFTPFKGLSDLQDIFYKFLNNQSRIKQLDRIDIDAFNEFIVQKVSAPKQKRIADLAEQHDGIMQKIFFLIRGIMKAKDDIIHELDRAESDVVATTKGEAGGEGYVKLGDKVKLVPRSRWNPF